MRVWRGPDGITVEVIILDRRPLLRVTQTVRGRRYRLGDCRRPSEVALYVDLADLVEVIELPV